MQTNSAPDPVASNAMARAAILGQSVDMTQEIYTKTITDYVAGQSYPINIPVRNVGMIKRFWVEITATVAQGAAETQTRSTLGPANVLSQVVLTDLSNQARINTTGWHLHNLASARRQLAFGAAFTSDSPTGFGSNNNVISAPASVTSAASLYMCYEIPVAYSDTDLRGAIYANVVNATMNLQCTINPNFFVATGANDVQAVYKSSTAQLGQITTLTIKVYQNYLDQLPRGQNGGVILPALDLSTLYMLNNSNVSGLAANADQAIPYANFRNFMSTFVIYDNAGTLNTGSDINYFALQSANFTNIFKYPPMHAALMHRTKINDDFPAGMYYFDHRSKPISTIQYGNMQLNVNPLTVTGSTSQLLVAWESLALMNMISQAGSLYQT